MPITQQQLESIKAANYAKSVAWEAAHFLPSEVVALHGRHMATRTENGWTCNQSGLAYATLSRWGRMKLRRATFYPLYYISLIVGREAVHLSKIPPITERRNYSPWISELPRYDPSAEPSGVNSAKQNERQSDVVTSVPPAVAAPEPPVSRLDGIDGRLDDIDASTTEQNKRLKNLEGLTESGHEDFHRRLIAQQGRIDSLEAEVAELKDRLLATAIVAAHISLFKDRIAALEDKCKNI